MFQDSSPDSDEVVFYSLSRRKICMRLSLPQLKERHCIDARFGWLLTQDLTGEASKVSLFNPLSGAQIELPSLRKIPSHEECYYAMRAVLSANPSSTPNFVVMVSWSDSQGLGVWRAGEDSWTDVKAHHKFTDITYYMDKLYAVEVEVGFTKVEIWTWDPFTSDLTSIMQYFIHPESYDFLCLAESSVGELLLIIQFHYFNQGPCSTQIRVCRLYELSSYQRETISGLGNDVIFLVGNASLLVAASDYPDVVEPNRVYFCCDDGNIEWYDSNGRVRKMGTFHLGNGRCEDFDGISNDSAQFRELHKPMWFVPSS